MKDNKMRNLPPLKINGIDIPCSYRNTLIMGSGAASLSAAVRLKRTGMDDLCIITDDINGGTSRNTGSDKQTYYKLSDSTQDPDSPYRMAEALFQGGAMHGDIALAEALGAENGFYHLVGLGVPFPFNRWGGYTGYKTDHDPQNRGTSLGPYTSKVMVEYLEKECRNLLIPIIDHHDCIRLICTGNRIAGALFLDKENLSSTGFGLKVLLCNNMIFGLGGPGGLYRTSVYPTAHTGGIGLALEAGAEAVNLTESQYGIGSTEFRWNLSGSYQQVIPRYYSRDPETGECFSFLNEYFPDMTVLANAVFLKGYQWPFDPHKIDNWGSSLIDILVYQETELRGREVYIDFRENLSGDTRLGNFSRDVLSREATEYWSQSGLSADTPIDRLAQFNPGAIELYKDNNIDLYQEPLRIAVCAQHNNGGLSADIWWESTNIKHFFPIGEVNGSHGVLRPGGTSLNSGQVAAFRAGQKIVSSYGKCSLDFKQAKDEALRVCNDMFSLITGLLTSPAISGCELKYQKEFQFRMSREGAFVREPGRVRAACTEADRQNRRFAELRINQNRLPLVLKLRHMVFAHWCYLESVNKYLEAGGGSRGSYLVKSDTGHPIHPLLGNSWQAREDKPDLRKKIQVISCDPITGKIHERWEFCRPIPREDSWFETVWAEFLNGTVFDDEDELDGII